MILIILQLIILSIHRKLAERNLYICFLSEIILCLLVVVQIKLLIISLANFKDINGTVKQTDLKARDLACANIGMDLSKSVHLNMTLSGSLRQNNMMAGGSTLGGSTTAISRTALDYAPFEMPDGDPSFSSENKTTIFSWLNDYEDIANDKTFNASMDLSWNIMKGLRYNIACRWKFEYK